MMVGNKTDLVQYREVSNEQALNKAKTLGIPLMETSALDSTNVKEAFHDLLKEMYKDMKSKLQSDNNNLKDNGEGLKLDTNQKKKKSGCC